MEGATKFKINYPVRLLQTKKPTVIIFAKRKKVFLGYSKLIEGSRLFPVIFCGADEGIKGWGITYLSIFEKYHS